MWKFAKSTLNDLVFSQNNPIKNFIALFHQLGSNKSFRIEFKSDIEEADVLNVVKLDEYKLYQLIHHDFLYNMEPSELDLEGIKYDRLYREKTSWFGLKRKPVSDILIHPHKDFLYPYQYGHYFYYYTKHKLEANQFKEWLNDEFPKRFDHFDELLGYNDNDLTLIYPDDYVLVTNHDYQKEFGIAASEEIVTNLIKQLNKQFTLKSEPFIIE